MRHKGIGCLVIVEVMHCFGFDNFPTLFLVSMGWMLVVKRTIVGWIGMTSGLEKGVEEES